MNVDSREYICGDLSCGFDAGDTQLTGVKYWPWTHPCQGRRPGSSSPGRGFEASLCRRQKPEEPNMPG